MIPIDKKRIVTLAGTLVLAGAVVAAGVYGPSVWKVFRQQSAVTDQIVLQTPAVDSNNSTDGSNGSMLPDGTAPPTAQGAAETSITAPTTVEAPPQSESVPKNKYREPDTKLIDLAPSVASYFGENALSNDAKTLIFGTAWNIHQYVDGYLYGPAAGPQMNEEDIKKYIVFHKTLLDKQYKNEANISKAATLTGYLDILLNSGIDSFDSKDKTRIEQFHQGIHDLDTHLMRNDPSSKVYGATPFATKR
ncbi:hypothetical protein Desor_5343 [Desulfosporosinus orientis DSM 765]|uniref:Uncharacterized protein n=1 Tax=Desulfosporosinus orientis (strain ATCC 19365 / DSM 765 / NCIMB 8382 / VKM B-1628 / Singapore I) TaxID=768706 RepID=G7WCA3_DESOD|nr:hypothetical protein [Desulfosporosinus orientis]AET70721.1 hypothetical protein Desor_5343 [Desulfosporosinus orientis DSM 765]